MRILLVQPASNIMKNRKEGKPALPPLGLMYIAGTLQANGFKDIKILDVMSEGYYNETSFKKDYIRYGLSPKEIKDKIREFNPDIIGVSIMASIRKYHAYEICKLAKEVNLRIVTVVGGNHATCFPKEALKKRYVDYAILGEGEQSFLNLVKTIKGQIMGFEDNGIAYDETDYSGTEHLYHISPQRDWEDDLDKIPFPAHDLIDLDLYQNIWKKEGYQTYEAKKFTMSVMARGCPNKCRHCPHDVLFPGYRFRSAQNIFDEVEWCYSLGIREIQYHEYNGLVHWGVVKEFCKLMIKSGLNKKMRWGWPIGIWLKMLNRERLKLMREAGMDYVCLAIESYDQKKLDEVMKGKDVSLKHTMNVIKWCREFDYQIHAFFMLGLEGQNKKDIRKTIDFCKTLDLDSVSFFIAQPLPGTPFWDNCVKNNLFYDDFDTFHLRYGKSNHKVKGLTAKELEDLRYVGRTEFAKSRKKSRRKDVAGKRAKRLLEGGCC